MRITAFCAVLAALWAVAPAGARACSWEGKAILSSLPQPGDVDVPIDVAPIIRGYWAKDSVTWETAEGTPVEFDLTGHAGVSATQGDVAELVPRAPLQPNTRYVISALMESGGNLGPDRERLEFETGSSPASREGLTPPSLELKVLTDFVSGCISAAAIGCMSVGDSSILLEIDDPDGHLLVRDVVTGDVTVHIPKRPGCGRAWTRSASGQLSPVTELCGSALARRPIRKDDLHFLTCALDRPASERPDGADAGAATDDDDDDSAHGCSVARLGGDRAAPTGLLIVVALIRRARRWRRGSRTLPA